MMYEILILPHFRKQLKHYAKKYRTLKQDLMESLTSFDAEPATHLGRNIYKIRLRSRDSGKGKSGGFRVIILIRQERRLIPLTIFAKNERSTMTLEEINSHLEDVLRELQGHKEN